MTNLLQPAGVAWFAVIKKAYREKWNHWFTFGDKDFTVNLNMKSPGYVLCSSWISEIWQEMSADLIRKSFDLCGVHNNHLTMNFTLSIRMDNLHSTLRTILTTEGSLLQQTIDTDTDLAEADMHMNNPNNDVFERGSGEDEIEFGLADDNIEMLENEAIRRIESNFVSETSPSQYEIQNNLQTELNIEIVDESPVVEPTATPVNTYYELVPEPVETTEIEAPITTVPNVPATAVDDTPVARVRRTRRTKLQMIAYRVCFLNFIQ